MYYLLPEKYLLQREQGIEWWQTSRVIQGQYPLKTFLHCPNISIIKLLNMNNIN